MCRWPLEAPPHTRPQISAHRPPMTLASLTLVKPGPEHRFTGLIVCCIHEGMTSRAFCCAVSPRQATVQEPHGERLSQPPEWQCYVTLRVDLHLQVP